MTGNYIIIMIQHQEVYPYVIQNTKNFTWIASLVLTARSMLQIF